jgi:hypothetical protein
MTITTKTFQNLQPGVQRVDDLRVRRPVNEALQWLGEGLVEELNTHFAAISQSVSVQIAAAITAFSNSNSVQISSAISVYASNRPTFFVHKNGVDQTSISANPTPLTFATEAFDVGGYFSTSTSSSAWVPPAGKYRLTLNIYFQNANAVANETIQAVILKNGSLHRQHDIVRPSTANELSVACSVIVEANGTDAFVGAARKSGAGTGTIEGDADRTWFCGEAIS